MTCPICGKDPHDKRCPNAPQPDYPQCPVCKKYPEEFFVNDRGEVVGCERCLHPREWWQLEVKP